MTALRVLLALMFVAIATYTGITVSEHGWNLLPVFFGDMATMGWPGQFNFDFSCFLILSGLWVSWRHQFSTAGLLLGIVAVFGGALFLSAYLLINSYRVDGDIHALILGSGRVN